MGVPHVLQHLLHLDHIHKSEKGHVETVGPSWDPFWGPHMGDITIGDIYCWYHLPDLSSTFGTKMIIWSINIHIH